MDFVFAGTVVGLYRRSGYRGLAVFPFLVILAALTVGGAVEFTVLALTFTAEPEAAQWCQ